MKQFTAAAAVLAIVVVFVWSRAVFVTAQQADVDVATPASPVALPTPAAGFNQPVQPFASAVTVIQPPAVATLNDLVRALKDVRQKKEDLQQQEEKLTTAIRKKIDEEKRVHEEVLKLLGPATRDDSRVKVNSIEYQKAEPATRETLPK